MGAHTSKSCELLSICNAYVSQLACPTLGFMLNIYLGKILEECIFLPDQDWRDSLKAKNMFDTPLCCDSGS